MFNHILVPIDGSPLSALALPIAAEMARCHHGKLTALYVVPPVPMFYGDPPYPAAYMDANERAKVEGLRVLDDARTALGCPDMQLLCLEGGDPLTAQAIADMAEQQQVSLVVMGTHGRSGLEHLLLGSVAEGVMHRVNVPVLLVRAPRSNTAKVTHAGSRTTFTPEVSA